MAIYAVRGACAAAYIAYGYRIWQNFGPSSRGFGVRDTMGNVTSFVSKQAEKLGLPKDIAIIEGSGIRAFGAAIFPRSEVIQVWSPDRFPLSSEDKFMITVNMARIKGNDLVLWDLVPHIAALFTTLVLNHRSPIKACIAGLVVGMAAVPIVGWWRVSVAGRQALLHCSKEDNQSFLDYMKHFQSKKTFWEKLVVTFFFGPLEWHIRTVENYIRDHALIEKG